MVRHLPAAVEIGILVPEGVEAVGAGGDHAAHAQLVHGRRVRLRQRGVEELAAEAAGRIARARLPLPQHPEAHLRLQQQAHDRLRDGHVALHQRPRTAHPVQVLLRTVEDRRLHALRAQLLHPRLPRELRPAPRVAPLLDVLQRLLRRARNARLLHHQIAAHVHDGGHVLDHDGTLLHAGHAGAAGPERLVLHVIAHQLAAGRLRRILARDEQRPRVVHVGLHVLDDGHGREGLARRPRRTRLRAAPAAHAGVGVEQLLPGEVPQRAPAQAAALLDELLEIAHGREVGGHGGTLEEGVDGRQRDVPELGQPQQPQQREGAGHVHPPEDAVRGEQRALARAAHDLRHRPARGRPPRPALVAARNLVPADAQPLHDEAREEHEAEQPHHDRVLRLAAVPRELGGRGPEAPEQGHAHADQPDQPEHVPHEAVAQVHAALEEGVLAAHLEDEREIVVDGQRDGHQREHREAGIDAPVHDARVAVVLHAARAHAHGQQVREARAEVAGHARAPAQPPDARPLQEGPRDHRHRQPEEEIHDGEAADVEENLALRPLHARRLQRADGGDDGEGHGRAREAHVEARPAAPLPRAAHARSFAGAP